MKNIIVCSSFYETGRKYLKDFFEGFKNASHNRLANITLNLAIDDLKNPELTLKKYKREFNIKICKSKKKLTVSETRNLMIKSALQLNGDVIIFIDMDDILLRDSINNHLEALKNAMISYADMKIINEKKIPLNYTLFEGNNVPNQVHDHKVLLYRNFFGLTNTALKVNAFKYIKVVPSHLKATDWWLFTNLLYDGCKAKKTKQPIGLYRQHKSNILGYKKITSIKNFIYRCQLAEDHFTALPKDKDFDKALEKVINIKNLAVTNPGYIIKKLKARNVSPSLWFSELFDIY